MGAKYVGQELGLENILATDLGGTTFDIGVVTKGQFSINLRPMEILLPI